MDVKLADFGISEALNKNYGLTHEQKGSLRYCSPELLSGDPYNLKTDIWALGCILHEIITLKPAYSNKDEATLRHAIVEGAMPNFLAKDIP